MQNDSNTDQSTNSISNIPSKKKSQPPKMSRLKARRMRARLTQQSSSQSYSEHLRITRAHNFKRRTQKIKQMSRNANCPALTPLTNQEMQCITNTVKQSNENLSFATNLGREFDDGNIEFKWKLIAPGPDRIQHLITQMTYRLGEGCGKCVYQIGIEDCGHPKGLSETELIQSIETIFLMGKQLNASVSIESIKRGIEGKVCTLFVEQLSTATVDSNSSEDHNIRVCVTGNESVGKSTLIGVLTRGKLDDGRGSARMNVFRHRHEIFEGRTSSISHHILGFDRNGIITNDRAFGGSNYRQIVKSSTKLITFVDSPGHERYFKTSVFGLTSHKPHYVQLTVSLDEFYRKESHQSSKSDNEQWTQMLSLNLDGLLDGNSSDSSDSDSDTGDSCSAQMRLSQSKDVLPQKSNDPSSDYHKYLTLCESINVPLFIVITKSDIDCKYEYKLLPKMLHKISTVISHKSRNKLKMKLIQTSSEAQRAARALASSVISYIPVIVASCVNGEGLQILKTFLFSLPSNGIKPQSNINNSVEFGIDYIYEVSNVGIVTSGIVRTGTIHIHDTLCIGPDKNGQFRTVTVQSIHVRRKDVSYTFQGQMASLCLSELKSKRELRRGMVLLDESVPKRVCFSFEAKIEVLNSMSLRENAQPIIHIENIRQSAHILHIHRNESSTAITAVFVFLHCAEFIKCGMKVIIRKSHGPIALGIVTKILDSLDQPLVPLNSLQKPHRLRMSKSKTNFKHYLQKWNLENSKKKIESTDISSNSSDIESENNKPKINECRITPIRDKGHKNKKSKQRKRKRKKKKYTLVWRSGLGCEHFYPKI